MNIDQLKQTVMGIPEEQKAELARFLLVNLEQGSDLPNNDSWLNTARQIGRELSENEDNYAAFIDVRQKALELLLSLLKE